MSDIVVIAPGQSVTLTASFVYNGMPANPPSPPNPNTITWTHNAGQGQFVNLTPSPDTMTAVLYVSGASTGTGTFSVFADCGTLHAVQIINIQLREANGIVIVAGPVVEGPGGQ